MESLVKHCEPGTMEERNYTGMVQAWYREDDGRWRGDGDGTSGGHRSLERCLPC